MNAITSRGVLVALLDSQSRRERRPTLVGDVHEQVAQVGDSLDRRFSELELLMQRMESVMHAHALQASREQGTREHVAAGEALDGFLRRMLPRLEAEIAEMESAS